MRNNWGNTSEILRDLRRERGWSQAEMAKRAGVSVPKVRHFEEGGYASFNTLVKIADALGMSTKVTLETKEDEDGSQG